MVNGLVWFLDHKKPETMVINMIFGIKSKYQKFCSNRSEKTRGSYFSYDQRTSTSKTPDPIATVLIFIFNQFIFNYFYFRNLQIAIFNKQIPGNIGFMIV